MAVIAKMPENNITPPSKLRKVYKYYKANTNRILETTFKYIAFPGSFSVFNYVKETGGNSRIHYCPLLMYVLIHTNSYLPWINATIKAQMRKRKRLYNKAKCSHSPSDWN